MTGFTRSTHTVRIKSNDRRFYADVEILDAISLTLPDGFDICYQISKPNIVKPNITDNTGDGNGKPGDATSTRASHMVRVTSTARPSMFFDVEVCDAFTITGPNNADFCLTCPPTRAVANIIDDTGSGIGVSPPQDSITRGQHVAKLLQQIGSGTAGQPDQNVPTSYTLTLLTDAMSYSGPELIGMPWQIEIPDEGGPGDIGSFTDYNSGPWYRQHALQFYNAAQVLNGALAIGANTNDTTVYVEDPSSGEQVPPDIDPTVDPNIYVYFPQTTPGPAPLSSDNTAGPFLGATPYTTKGVPGGDGNIPAIDMGPIWWLRALGCTDNVWFWYISPVQQPLAVSYFGDPPSGAGQKWGYRGAVNLPSFPVDWLISVNYAIVGMGTYGAPNLVTAAGGTIMGKLDQGGTITVNWGGVTIPPPSGGFGLSTTWVVRGGLGVGLPLVAYTLYSYYMPYGAFDLLDGSRAEKMALAKALHLDTSIYTDYGGPPANIWELTGIPQPPLLDPKKIWSPVTNPHRQPSKTLAKQVCETFRDKWNVVANALDACAQPGGAGMSGYPNVPPPDWDWALPYGGDSVATAQMFSNGWVPAVIEAVTVPITVPTIGVGQLDAKIWDVTPTIKDGTPPVPRDWLSYQLSSFDQNPESQSIYDLALTLGTP